ncbi:MAG: dihydrolipoyl dehydrogenase [Chlamydiae bacterium CG10_big_fil_rev_8_21_14_0_10_35_9]|nr:MAG: dihydrolipoyl dehydrogenase [Chlamydiae bacterium CG10_big_fil_rev_8_21_14_0_10_35_9]
MRDYQVAVIGAGPGGYVAAIKASQLGLKTVCIEKRKTLGGTCLNVGCIPSKCLLHSSELFFQSKYHFSHHGIDTPNVHFDFSKMQTRKNEVVKSFVQGIDFLFKKNKVEHIEGYAKLVDPYTIEVEGKKVTADNIILATGSEPIELDFLKFDEKKVVSSTGALELSSIPKKMAIVGAGIIGVELGSVFSRLGASVEFVEFLDRICPTFDKDISDAAYKVFTKQGMKFSLSHKVTSAKVDNEQVFLQVEGAKKTKELQADTVLVAIGRKPNSSHLGLEKVGIQRTEKGFIRVNDCFQTNYPHIFAIGDVIGGQMLAHKASEEGICVVEFIKGTTLKLSYVAIPSVAYTYPEIASVGFMEKVLQEKNIPYKSFSFPMKANSRAKCTGQEEGFVKVLGHKTDKTLLGVHIIAANASELIGEAAVAIQKKMTIDELANTPHAHPTLSEAIKEASLGAFDKPLHL